MVLCGANFYNRKYYFEPAFDLLPEQVKQELQILCVTFTEEFGGVLTLQFDDDGKLMLVTDAEEDDITYDEIGSALRIKQLREEKRELFESLELFYQTFAGGEF